ncbi:MAG: glutamine amidotransferase [Caulobacter sp.]
MKAIAIRHVHFEDLGVFEPVLRASGYAITTIEAHSTRLIELDPLEPDLLIVLGGPVGVGDAATYPFIARVQALLAARIEARRPTLGLCLGAQQIAAALGAQVAPMEAKEIGFGPLTLTDAGKQSPLRHLDGVSVLHWHGDAFKTPHGATRLASTPACHDQAFALGKEILALQFHPEADVVSRLEPWLIGHAAELAAAGVDPNQLRRDAALHGGTLVAAGQTMIAEWLDQLPYA